MAERHPGWANGITASEARLATGLLVAAHGVGDALGPLRVRTGIRDAGGHPGLVTRNANKLTVNPFQAVIADPAQPADGPYLVTMDTAKELDVEPPSQNAYRTDLVVAEVIDTEPGFTVSVYEGQPSSSTTPPKPEVTNRRSLVLAEVRTFPANQQSPDPDDTRSFTAALNGILPVRDVADRPAYPHGSAIIYRMDAGVIEVSRNGAWVPYRPPRGSVDTWHDLELKRGWTPYSSTAAHYPTPGYTITEDGWVRFRGLIKGGVFEAAFTAPIFTLPTGYRPAHQHVYLVSCVDTGWVPQLGRIDVRREGVYAISGKNGWLSLDGIAFATY